MELTLLAPSFPFLSKTISNYKPKIQNASGPAFWSSFYSKSHEWRREKCMVSYALPETAASIVVATIVVGAAATVLLRRTKASETDESSLQICQDCGGSGICAECNGEGFVLKKLTEESAEKARMASKSMATRYTAGLPKKWSYCSKCSSARSCSTCGGRGKVSL
ncbi:uncharacterized protein LOC143855499 [Tasmannia lanceolata]|uniref:uncharacterized protein LOC143855499 n=1 Tax=Tasmannia lanceolata TaxID=3420 RepID=UPI004063C3AE